MTRATIEAKTVGAAAVRCAVVAGGADGAPLLVLALDVVRLLGDPAVVAELVLDAWGSGVKLPESDDGCAALVLRGEHVRVSAERLPFAGRMTPVLLVVTPADVGAVPRIVIDLRPMRAAR